VQGKSVMEARQLRREDLIRALGGLPQASTHASHLAIDTLAAVIQQLRTEN
jgi:NifU-like protein involved in Fe-S cluster formation